jgi:hypothetical protein
MKNIRRGRLPMICFLPGLFLFFLFSQTASGQPKSSLPSLVITTEKNENIRDIAKKYLNNPDLWEDILRANNLKKPEEIRPGIQLRIPVEAICRANTELENSKKRIQEATEAGAKIFATEVIAEAISLRNAALEKRTAGDWAKCTENALSAEAEAKKAYEISKSKHDVPAQAVLNYCQGEVESKKTSEDIWKNINLYDILLEGERIRTLSQSSAEILFKDDSRLQLKENAQALIRKMRANLLERSEEAKVSLIEGNVLALLSGGKKVQLEVEGIETNADSRRFRAGKDDEGQVTWFAVDDGELEIKAQGKKVLLKKNQGSVVPKNLQPSDPKDLLPPPILHEPPDGEERFDMETTLKWEKVRGAESYLLELSENASFSQILWSERIPDTTGIFSGSAEHVFPRQIGGGAFYWRVTAISTDKLPGRISKSRFLRIIADDTPPFLVVQSPASDQTVSEKTLEISGSTENGVSLFIQNQPVKIGGDGKYQFQCALSEGENRIIVKAVDRSGNISKLERVVTCTPTGKTYLSFDPALIQSAPNCFVLKQPSFILSGNTQPGSAVAVRNEKFSASSLANAEGRFEISVRTEGQKEEFEITVTPRSGETKTERFSTEIDTEPPVIHFSQEIPSATKNKEISLGGQVEGATVLKLNGKEVMLEKEKDKAQTSSFQVAVQLNPGMNTLRFELSDIVENFTVVEKEILLDSDPPELTNYSLSLQDAKGGEEIRVTVRAEDASDLVKASPFVIQIGDRTYKGYMTRSGAKKEYAGSFRVPNHVKGKVKLKSVTLSDYIGNEQEAVVSEK